MPTINQNASAQIALTAGQWIQVTGTGVATLLVGQSKGQQQHITNSGKVGPFDFAQTVSLTATGGAVTYTVLQDREGALVVEDSSGSPVGIITPDGQPVGGDVGEGVNANTEDSATISISRQIKASAGRVTSIVCTYGTSIALTLYDNAAASATGRQIYAGTLSGGDVVQPADAWFGQGCFASFSGTASFVVNTSESEE